MYSQLITLLLNHDCFVFTFTFILIIFYSLLFLPFKSTIIILTVGLIYYGFKLQKWISRLPQKEPISPRNYFDDYIFGKITNWIHDKIDLNSVNHCDSEVSIANETFHISENLCKNYILLWYSTISQEPAFPADAERAIFELIHTIFRKLSEIDAVELSKDLLFWLQLMVHPSTRDEVMLSNDDMNNYLESCIEKVLISCSPSVAALADKEKPEGGIDPLALMIKDLLTKAAIVPIFDLISDPEFINHCVARLFNIKISDSPPHDNCEEAVEQQLSLIPLKNFNEGVRSISVDTSVVERNVFLNSELSLTNHKAHKRSLSQPGDLGSSNQSSDQEKRLKNQTVHDDNGAVCESGIDLDSLPNLTTRVFRNIRITKSEPVRTSKEIYTVYLISVEALFEEIHPENIYQTSDTTENTVASSLIWKQIIVKHRFREFVDLQINLESNPRLKGALKRLSKNVIKPSTLKLTVLNLVQLNPLRSSVTNKPVIEHRRRCLERYLNELAKSENISRSKEFRNFLGYKAEKSNFLRNPSQSILLPLGIDKVYRNVRDAITFLKPTNPQEGTFAPGPSLVVSDSPLTFLKLMKLPYGKPYKIQKFIDDPKFIQNIVQSSDAKKENITENKSPDICFLNLGRRSQGDGCDNFTPTDLHPDRKVEIPLLDQVIELIKILFPLSSYADLALLSIKIYLGKTLERSLKSIIYYLCCTETFVYLLHTLHESIWEDDDNEIWVKHEISSSSQLVKQLVDILRCKKLFKHLSYTFLEKCVQPLFNTFQSKEHNKMFLMLLLSSLLKRSQI